MICRARVAHATFYVKDGIARFYQRPERRYAIPLVLNNGYQYLEAYQMWRSPATDVWNDNGYWLGYEWWPDYCLDCRYDGGTNKRPPEWPI